MDVLTYALFCALREFFFGMQAREYACNIVIIIKKRNINLFFAKYFGSRNQL